jgi:hypothetical protein
MRWTVAQLETGIVEFVKVREQNVDRLMKDPVRNRISAWSFVRCRAPHCSLHFRQCDLGTFNWTGIVVSVNVR